MFSAGAVTTRAELRGNAVPARCLAQTFSWSHADRGSELIDPLWAFQRFDPQCRPTSHRQQQLFEAFKRGRLDSTLDPADRVLARPSAHRETSLAQSLFSPRFAENHPEIYPIMTPHTVSY
jgi:hypothetical protein